MKTLTQFKKELIAERPQLEEMIANDLAELQLSEQLRKLRKDAGLTQKAVAEKMHVTRAYISQLEGKPQNVQISTLLKYARAVGGQFRFTSKLEA
jgi:DNA-binding XRE family transcriptional regulator